MRMSAAAWERAHALPPRPYLPPILAAAVAACAAAAYVLHAGWERFASGGGGATAVPWMALAQMLALAAALSCAAAWLWRRAGRRSVAAARYLVALVLGTALAVVGATTQAARLDAARAACAAAPVSARTLVPIGDPARSAYGWTTDALVEDDSGTLGTVSLSSSDPLSTGVRIRAVGRFTCYREDGWEERGYYAGRVGRVRLVRILAEEPATAGPIERARAAVLAAIDPTRDDARSLVAGIVCGRTTELNQADASDAFARTGTSHLVAVSGSHLALVAVLIDAALRRTPARVRAGVLLMAMAAYVCFTGSAPSAVRSLIMVGAAQASSLGRRRAHGISGLGLAVCVLVACDAGVVFDLGFQLSALSVLFILVFSGYLRYVLEGLGLARAIAEPLALTLCAQWATLPVTTAAFGSISLIASLANLVLGPVMSALLVAGLIGAPPAALVAPVAGLALAPALALARVSIFLAAWFSGLPFAALPIDAASATPALAALMVLAGVVWVRWRPLPARIVLVGASALMAAAGAYLAFWTFAAPPTVTILDVGQGDAILVRDGPTAVLVDCGVDDAIGGALARQHVFRLDAVAITHWDRDHWGGLETVLDAVPVGELIVPAGAERLIPDEAAALPLPPCQTMAVGDVAAVGGFSCRMVWPEEQVSSSDNEASLVWDVRYRGRAGAAHVLLTGDTEADALEAYADAVGDVDVLKLGHHGSAASVSDDALVALDPELAVASAGAGNAYGHPSPEAVSCVRDAGCAFVCTIDAGDVAIAPTPSGVRVTPSRGSG